MNFKNVLLLTTVTWLISDIECNTTTVAIPDPCQNYQILDSNSRQHTIQGNNGLCDNNLNEGWYKLEINGRAAEIPNVCLQHDVCGTRLPLRIDLEGMSMPVVGVTLETNACTSYEVLGQWDCCVLRQPVTIKNCGLFYVYHLRPTDRCPVAYCAQEVAANPSDQVTRKRGDPINNIVLSSTTTIADMATSGSNITETTTGIPMNANTTSVSGSSSVSTANAGPNIAQNMTTTVPDYSTESSAVLEQTGNATTDSTVSNPTSGNSDSTLPVNNLTNTESSTVSAAENATDVPQTAGNNNVTIATEAPVESITENVTATEQTTVVSGIVDDNNGTNVSSTVNTTNRTGLLSRSTTVSTQRTTITALECTNWPQVNCTERNTTCYVSPSNNETYTVCADGSACGALCDGVPDCADEKDEKFCRTGMICLEGQRLCADESGCFNRCDGHVTCNTMAPGEDEDGCPTKPTTSPALSNTTFTNASLTSTTQLDSGSSSSVTTVSPSTVQLRSTDDQTTNATTQQASPTTTTSGSPTTPTSGSPTTPTSGSPTTPTSGSPTTPTSASPTTPTSTSAATGPISSTSAPIPTFETFSTTDADNMTATLNNTIGGLSSTSNTITTPSSVSSSDTSTNAPINTESNTTLSDIISTESAGSSTNGSSPSSSGQVFTIAVEQTSSQTTHTQSMTTTEPEGASLSTHALTSESTVSSSQSTTESVESSTGISPDSRISSARPSSSQESEELTTEAAPMVTTTVGISTRRIPVTTGSTPSDFSSSTAEVKQSTSTSASSSTVLTTENTVAKSAVSSTSAPPSSGTESVSAVSTESRTLSTVITAGDVSRTDSVSTSGHIISSSTERGTVTDSRNASAEFSSVTGSQPTSSAENQTEADHTVYMRKEKKGLYYENFGLFVFLIVAGAVIAGVCMFGLIGYTYQRRLRTWNPSMSYQDAYGDLEKKTLSFGRDKHGIESPIPDFDILRDEKNVEETSLSQASTLALCSTPGKTEPPFDDSYDDVVTNGKPPNGAAQPDNEVSYISNGNTNEGFVADDNVDGIVPVDDLDTSAPRALFPWIENAADTKL